MGNGIYKSTDAGKSWRNMGPPKSGRIGRIIVPPSNPDIVFACVLGRVTGPQQERGVSGSGIHVSHEAIPTTSGSTRPIPIDSSAAEDLDRKLRAVESRPVSQALRNSDDKYFVEPYGAYLNLIWLNAEVGTGGGDVAGSAISPPA